MAAKDIIDLQVGVDDLEAVTEPFRIALAPLGFERLPYDRDHVPAGRDDAPAVWAKRFWRRRSVRDGDVNLHGRVVGAPNFRLALLFRDWLRAHPDAVAAYATFKRALAAATPDADTYTEVKDPVVDLVVSVAERWASESGWAP
jgi:dephospho-CoA kinase